MRVAKKFKWEAAHRIPWHESKCKNIHGHSYKMIVEFEGKVDELGIVIDFNDMKMMVEPIVNLIDHSTIIADNDVELKEIFQQKGWKHFLLPYDSTAENLCAYFLNAIIGNNKEFLLKRNVTAVGVQIFETETAYAQAEMLVK